MDQIIEYIKDILDDDDINVEIKDGKHMMQNIQIQETLYLV